MEPNARIASLDTELARLQASKAGMTLAKAREVNKRIDAILDQRLEAMKARDLASRASE